MASLIDPHLETISREMLGVIQQVGKQLYSKRFYLGGGTAIALQLGHRVSEDLDFFSEEDELLGDSRNEIISTFGDVDALITSTTGTLVFTAHNVRTGFFGYGYPLMDDKLEFENVHVASLLDLGLMKLDALAGRASRKDFFDIYFLAQQVPLEKLLAQAAKKFPRFSNFALNAIENLVYFDYVEGQDSPALLRHVEWEQVKKFFVAEAKRLSKSWYGL